MQSPAQSPSARAADSIPLLDAFCVMSVPLAPVRTTLQKGDTALVIKAATLRELSALGSAVSRHGTLSTGTRHRVQDVRVVKTRGGSKTRVRLDGGWASAVANDGDILLNRVLSAAEAEVEREWLAAVHPAVVQTFAEFSAEGRRAGATESTPPWLPDLVFPVPVAFRASGGLYTFVRPLHPPALPARARRSTRESVLWPTTCSVHGSWRHLIVCSRRCAHWIAASASTASAAAGSTKRSRAIRRRRAHGSRPEAGGGEARA